MRRIVGLAGWISLVVPAGCGEADVPTDSCTGGDNVTNPRVLGTLDATATTPVLLVEADAGTDRGAGLPGCYFDAVALDLVRTPAPVEAIVAGVEHRGARVFAVSFDGLDGFLATESVVSLTLAFPDRRDFIECSHPGMADRYLLTITLQFSGLQLVSTDFSQDVELGAI